MGDAWPLWGLFSSAFVSATLFPGGSEALLAVLHVRGGYDAATLLAVASLGNALGGMSSWLLGRLLPVREASRERTERAVQWLRRWGSPVLLLSWLPFVGDPLCVAAGWLRIAWLPALVYITVGKTLRYTLVLLVL